MYCSEEKWSPSFGVGNFRKLWCTRAVKGTEPYPELCGRGRDTGRLELCGRGRDTGRLELCGRGRDTGCLELCGGRCDACYYG